MKAKLTLNNGTEYDCKVEKYYNELTFSFPDVEVVPWDIISHGRFNIEFQPTEMDIGCHSDCETCLTPIC
jgi:hypothetical protein